MASHGAEDVGAPSNWLRSLATSGLLRFAILPLSAVCAVLTARITILSTGVEAYGYVNTVAMLFLIIPFADLGVGATVSNTVARRHAVPEGRAVMYRAILSSTRILIFVCFTLTVAILFLVFSETLGKWLDLPQHVALKGNTPIFLALFAFACSIPVSIGQRMLIGSGNNTLLAFSSLLAPITTLTYSYLCSLIERPPLYFAVGPALGIFLTNLFATWCATRILGISATEICFDVLRIKTHRGASVMDTAWPMCITGTAFTVIFFSHRLLLAKFSDATELATYALSVQLFFPAWSVIYMSGTILWSEFAGNKNNFQTWVQANTVLVAVSLCGAIGLYLVGPPVVRIMSPGNEHASGTVLLAFGVLLLVMGLDMTQTMLLVSAPELRIRAYWAVGVIAVFATLCVPAIRTGGGEGIIWLTAATFFAFQTLPNLVFGYRKLRSKA